MVKEKKVTIRWASGNTGMPVLAESYRSFRTVFEALPGIIARYLIYYNGDDYQDFVETHAESLPGAEIIDQKVIDSSDYPVTVAKSLWKQFPRIKLDSESYELFVDSDHLLVNCGELLEWIHSPVHSILLYKNDSNRSGYRRGPDDVWPYVEKVRYTEDGKSLFPIDTCAGFYGTPPGVDIDRVYLDTIEYLLKENPAWGNPSTPGYGSDLGIFFLTMCRFAVQNRDFPLFISSYEEHPFLSMRQDAISGWVDFGRIEAVHLCGATVDWRSDHQRDFGFYRYVLKQLAKRKGKPKKFYPKKLIRDFALDVVEKDTIKGKVRIVERDLSRVLSFPVRVMRRLLKQAYPSRWVFNRMLNRIEVGQYEAGLYFEAFALPEERLLLRVSIDVRDGEFHFDPRVRYQGPVMLVIRHYDKILHSKRLPASVKGTVNA